MYTINTVIREAGATPGLLKKHWKVILKGALQDLLQHWWRRNLPLHFTQGAAKRYGYRRRTSKYEMRKRMKYGHTIPLVWSGRTMRAARREARISGTGRKARIALGIPAHPYGNTRLAAEILRVTPAEERRLAQALKVLLTKRINKLKKTRTIKV